jgi:hypothetical protein
MKNFHKQYILKAILVLGMLAYIGISVYETMDDFKGDHSKLISLDIEEQNDSKESEEKVTDTELEENFVYSELRLNLRDFKILKMNLRTNQMCFSLIINYLELSTPPPEQKA